MSLELLIQVLCEFGLKRNLVNWASAGPSIYAINPEEIKNYPFLFISPTERIQVGKNTTEYGLTIYYADRLLDDSSNETQIFSMGAETLTNFLRQIENLEGIVEVSDPSIRLFTNSEKMQDRLSGAYTVVTITVLNSANCPIYYDSEGGAIGSFLPAGYGDIKTLVTEQEFLNTIKHYTLTKNFATINGSAITEGGDIVIEGGSGVTPDLSELSAQTVSNTSNIETLSGACGSLRTDLETLSAYTATISGGTTPDLSQLSAQTVANTEAISAISGSVIEIYDNFSSMTISAITDGYFLFWLPTNSYPSTSAERYATLYDYLERGLWQMVAFYKGTHKDRFGKIFTYQVFKDENNLNYYWITTYVPNTVEDHIYKVLFEIGKNFDGTYRYTIISQDSVVGHFFTYETEVQGMLSGYTTSAATAELSAATSGIAVDLQALSAYTESIVIPDLTDYTTTATTAELSATTSALSVQVQQIAASAVTSETVRIIWTGSQISYDLINPKDPNTFYIITG